MEPESQSIDTTTTTTQSHTTESVATPSDTATKKPASVLVPITTSGAMTFTNQIELGHAATMLIQMNLAPNHLKSEGKTAVMSALIMCRQFNLPDTAMNEMAYVKGKLTCFGSLVTALAERHPEYGEKEEFFIDENCERISVANKNLKAMPWASVIRIRKKGSTVWNEYFFSLDDAHQAGLLTENTKRDSGWVKYTKDLLMHKTKSRAFKANYASALNGVNYHEDVVEVISKEREVKDIASELSDAIKGD